MSHLSIIQIFMILFYDQHCYLKVICEQLLNLARSRCFQAAKQCYDKN